MTTRTINDPNTYKIVLDRIKTDSLYKESCRPFFVIFILLSQFALSSNMTIDMKVRAIKQENGKLYLDCQKINPNYKEYIIEIPPSIHNEILEFIDNKKPEDYVFTTSRGGKYYQQKFSSYLSQLSSLLDIPDLNSIQLRALAGNTTFWSSLKELNSAPLVKAAQNPLTPLNEITSCYKKIVESQNISCDIASKLYECDLDSIVLLELNNRYSHIIEQQKRLQLYFNRFKELDIHKKEDNNEMHT